MGGKDRAIDYAAMQLLDIRGLVLIYQSQVSLMIFLRILT